MSCDVIWCDQQSHVVQPTCRKMQNIKTVKVSNALKIYNFTLYKIKLYISCCKIPYGVTSLNLNNISKLIINNRGAHVHIKLPIRANFMVFVHRIIRAYVLTLFYYLGCRARWRITAVAHNLWFLIGQIACQSSSLRTVNCTFFSKLQVFHILKTKILIFFLLHFYHWLSSTSLICVSRAPKSTSWRS